MAAMLVTAVVITARGSCGNNASDGSSDNNQRQLWQQCQ